jgi:polar amino acid transport system ATP-binding protein
VSFSIEKGSVVGLAGESGSGKSTLLRCIQGLERVDEGSISNGGCAGFIFQDFQLFPHMTAMENIVYAPARQRRWKKNTSEKAAIELLDTLRIRELADRYPAQLSGGQKQRVALARSLILKPDILLCDEPTSGLDIATTGDVIDVLKSVENQKMTMIIASHDLDFLGKIADRILVLRRGKLVADISAKGVPNLAASLRPYYGRTEDAP